MNISSIVLSLELPGFTPKILVINDDVKVEASKRLLWGNLEARLFCI